jgi:hypothetical protein
MKPQVARAIRMFGEPVDIIYREGGTTITVSASVQRPIADGLVGDFDQDGFVVYIAHDDITVPLQKFDRIRVRGELRSVESSQVETLKGEEICYMARVRG